MTYQGVQAAAYNNRVIAGVKQYVDAIEIYRTVHDSYPVTSIEQNDPSATIALTCLGTGYANNECGVVTGTTVYEDSTFNDAMKEVLYAPPALGSAAIVVGGESFTGAVYGIDHVIGYARGRTIQYALIGENQGCKLSGAYGYNVSTNPPTTACEILLEPMN